jgi:hypothetical protein
MTVRKFAYTMLTAGLLSLLPITVCAGEQALALDNGDIRDAVFEAVVPEGTTAEGSVYEAIVPESPEAEDTVPFKGVPAVCAYVTTANLNLRGEPNTEAVIYETVPRGTTVYVTDFLDYAWYLVNHRGLVGYMKAEYLQPAPNPDDKPVVRYAETTVGIVELLTWADAKPLFKIGIPAQVTDVRTGIVYWVASFANGPHADVEPITPDDTAAMKRSFGGKWKWDPRPILVTINGRTLAASINGMPHGGGVNKDNNMNGQICIHFKDSKTNNGNRAHERDHQNAVQEAFDTASRW